MNEGANVLDEGAFVFEFDRNLSETLLLLGATTFASDE